MTELEVLQALLVSSNLLVTNQQILIEACALVGGLVAALIVAVTWRG